MAEFHSRAKSKKASLRASCDLSQDQFHPGGMHDPRVENPGLRVCKCLKLSEELFNLVAARSMHVERGDGLHGLGPHGPAQRGYAPSQWRSVVALGGQPRSASGGAPMSSGGFCPNRARI